MRSIALHTVRIAPPSHSPRCHTRDHKRKQLTKHTPIIYQFQRPSRMVLKERAGAGVLRRIGIHKAQFGVYVKQNLETMWPGASKSGSDLHHALSARPAKTG